MVRVPKSRFVSYLRVSTARQGASGLGLEAQRAAVAAHLNGGDWTLLREIVEIESGKGNDRPALAEALRLCRQQKATLVIAKLDRLARNVHFISGLMESGVEFLAVTCRVQTASLFTSWPLLRSRKPRPSASEQRRRWPPQRNGAQCWVVGAAARQAFRVLTAKRRAQVLPVIQEIQGQGISTLREIAAELNAKVVDAPREGQWSAVQVQRVLARVP